ncbi:MAG: diguanylate cyclase [Candidatus Rokubacteria bacterium GWC2_70_16]|nr:MAG: diguanylate cyclase [Candidatus Rokubacteria bacterium GWC2_70_16]
MRSYLVRRLLAIIPTLLAVSVAIFLLLHAAPGGPMAVYANNPNVDPEDLKRLEASLGLHDPYPVQYVKWLGAMLTGNWGISYKYARPVGGILGDRLLATVQLVLASLVIASVVAIPVGVLGATTRPVTQRVIGSLSMLGVSIPTFWLGIVVLLIFSVRLRVLPSGGMATIGADFALTDRLWHLVGPAVVLATLEIAGWSRYLRSMLLEAMRQDYIQTARAKGLSEARVILLHALRNALLPLITLLGLQGGRLVGGAMITETVFSWPGMGRLLVESLAARDYPVLMASFMLMAVLVLAGNLAADLTYAVGDPRIRLD